MPITSPQDFKAAASRRRKTKDVEIEGVGTVRLRALSAGDAQAFQADVKKAAAEGRDQEELAFPLIARSWIGENGELWLPESEGVALAKALDPEIYNALAKEVLKLNGLDVPAEQAVERAEKNSDKPAAGPTPTG